MLENLLAIGMFLVFLTLKLTGYIAWSWFYVTAPLWLPPALALLVWLIAIASIWVKIRLDRAKKIRGVKWGR